MISSTAMSQVMKRISTGETGKTRRGHCIMAGMSKDAGFPNATKESLHQDTRRLVTDRRVRRWQMPLLHEESMLIRTLLAFGMLFVESLLAERRSPRLHLAVHPPQQHRRWRPLAVIASRTPLETRATPHARITTTPLSLQHRMTSGRLKVVPMWENHQKSISRNFECISVELPSM